MMSVDDLVVEKKATSCIGHECIDIQKTTAIAAVSGTNVRVIS